MRTIVARYSTLPHLAVERLPNLKMPEIRIPSGANFSPVINASVWTPSEMRTGVLAIKKGMMSMWDPWGRMMPLEDVYVVGHRTKKEDGVNAVLVGCRRKELQTEKDVDDYQLNIGLSRNARLGFCVEKIRQFEVSEQGFLPIGMQLSACHFAPGQLVDVQGVTKDKGFQGVMKRWGFKGQSASHGTSLAHRSPGSIGQRKDPGKVWKGKKMPGQMGKELQTVHSLRVVKIDKELNLIYVKGGVPGPNEKTIVAIRDAIFETPRQFDAYKNPPPFPTISSEAFVQLPREVTWTPSADEVDPVARKYNL